MYFYDNPITRDDCVGMAYNAFVKKNGVITPSQNPSTADAVPLPLGKGGNNAGNDLNGNTQAQAPSIPKPKRAHENASSSGAAAPDSRMDVESMSLKDFDKIYEKVKRGETVMP